MNSSIEKSPTVIVPSFDEKVEKITSMKKSPKTSSVTKSPKVLSVVNIRIRSIHIHKSPCFTKNQWLVIVISLLILILLVTVLVLRKLEKIDFRTD